MIHRGTQRQAGSALTRPRGRGARPAACDPQSPRRTVLIAIAVVLLSCMAIPGHHLAVSGPLGLPVSAVHRREREKRLMAAL